MGSLAIAATFVAVTFGCTTAGAKTLEEGTFVTVCKFSHASHNDPIVLPRKRGASHLHHFFGNQSTNARSTPRKLRRRPATTCTADDRSAYWFPAFSIREKVIEPTMLRAYYVSADKNPRTIQAPPKGLKVVAGNGSAVTPQPIPVTSWNCSNGPLGPLVYTTSPECAQHQKLVLAVHFPDCWNGRDLDSRDHQSHLAYSTPAQSLFGYATCPATHPVAIPALQARVLYPTHGARSGAELSSGGVYSGHADFMNGWPQAKLEALVDDCIRRAVDCAT